MKVHPYRVKEILWIVIFLLFLLMSLVGCSSTPTQSRLVASNQYCHTKQTIQTQNNERVNSETLVKCSDDPVDQYAPARAGLAKDCYETYVPINIGGKLVKEKMNVCKKLNGTYTVVDSFTMR
jgi:hypothetical protein